MPLRSSGLSVECTPVRLDAITISRRGLTLIDNLSVLLNRGDVLGIQGASGCGKTTLLRCIAGLSDDYTGHIQLDAPNLAMVFQEPRLLPWRTILANVMLPLTTPDALLIAEEWLERVHLGDVMDMYPAQLSGGMRQRVAIARALAAEPDVLLVDEPFSSLDKPLAKELRDMLSALIADRQLTTCWVSHDSVELRHIATHHLTLYGHPGSWTITTNPEREE